MRSKFLALLIASIFSISSSADEVIRHQEVIVTAAPVSADDIDTEFQTGRVTVISSKQFEADLATVADVLRKETGIQIRQSSGLGSYSSVSVRGSTSAQVNVYLDGVLVNNAQGGTVDLSQFLLSGVESIEIYRGNVPVQLGAAGIGGAININTKNASKQDLRQVVLGVGSLNTKKAALTLSSGNTETRYLGVLERLSSDNDYLLLNNGQTTNNTTDDVVERRQNAKFEQASVLMSVHHKLSEQWHANLVAQHFDKINGIPEVSNSPDNDSDFGIQNTSLQLKLEQTLNPETALTYLIYGGQRKTRYDDLENKIGVLANLEKTKTDTLGFKADLARSYGAHFFNISAQARSEHYTSEDFLQDSYQKVERSEFVLAVQDEWLSTSGSLMLSSRLSARAFTNTHSSDNETSDTDQYLDWHLGLRYQLNENSVLRANISRDIRIPSLNELYGDTGAVVGNEDLTEEQAWNADLSLDNKFDGLEFGGAVFYRQLNDAIVMIYNARGIGQASNVSKANVIGIELEGLKAMYDWWDLKVKFTTQKTEDQSSIPSSRGNPLPGQYESIGRFVNTFSVNKLEYIFEYEHRSGGFYGSGAAAAFPTSNQFHFTLNYRLNAHRLELQVKNLSDERISDFNRFPGPGRRAFLSYAYTF